MANKARELEVDTTVRQVVMLILHIMRNLRQSGMEIGSDIELSYPQILILYALLENGAATMGELSRWLKITQGVATRTVDGLVDKGLVERVRDEEDRRVVTVRLSARGQQHAEQMITLHLEKLHEVFLEIKPADRKAFVDVLAQIDSRLEE